MNIIAHRGAAGLAPENTLTAITAGIAAGADHIEIDVRVTKDGTPIVWHYKKLLGKKISQATYSELTKLKPDLATFDEAMRAVNRKLPVRIEVKPHEPLEPIIAVLKKLVVNGWRHSDFALASFSPRTLRTLKVAFPDAELVVNERWSGVRASYRARQLHTTYICMNYRFLWWGFIKSMAKSGYKLSAYTLNDPQKAARWAVYGLDGVVTDYPDRFTTHK